MPPGGKLPAGEQEVLSRWVQDGAPWGSQPAVSVVSPASPPAGPASPQSIAAARREWSHLPVVRPPVPAVEGRDWVRNPIDAFLLARLEAERLHPAPEADRVTLIRRLAYDLTGLPPAPEDVDAFLADREPGAYERLVDRLLASPQYGEHWARHWLDLVRYGETNGYERDSAKPVGLAVSRLRDRCLQPRQAVRPVRPRATGRRSSEPGLGRGPDRHGLLSPGDLGRRALRPRAGPLRRTRRGGVDHGPGLPGDHDQLRPVSRPQGRPGPAGRLLPVARLLQGHHGSGREEPEGGPGRAGAGQSGRGHVRRGAGARAGARPAPGQPCDARPGGRARGPGGARRRIVGILGATAGGAGRWRTG